MITDASKGQRKREEDARTLAILEKLQTAFPESGPNDRKRIVDAVADCLGVKRKPLDGEDPDKTWLLPMGAAKVLGTMHPESAQALAKAVGDKALREHDKLFGAVADAVARAGDEPARELLLGLLDAKEAVAPQARLVHALRHFKDASEKERKEIFERVMQAYLTVSDRMDDNNDLVEGLEILVLFKTFANGTLTALADGHDESTAADWKRWWDGNRRSPWPQAREKTGGEKEE